MMGLRTWKIAFLEGELDKVYGHIPTTSAGESSGLPKIDKSRGGL